MPAVATAQILAAADALLEAGAFQDYGPNGLQVPGPSEVERIYTGVSANAQLFQLAAARGPGLLLVHHGLFWGSGFTTVDPALKHRLKLLFDADLALAAYHLPLDAHPQLGNNALLAKALGARDEIEPFASHRGRAIGFIATLPGRGLPLAQLTQRIAELTGQAPLVQGAGPHDITRLGIVSGGGADYAAEAAAAGAQALLTGETSERVMAIAQELQVHVIAAGHYATETLGIKALGEHLADRFGIQHAFLDVPNPV
ncbi:MAG TPA: Nif3-like dinuclear metal center hexameric protein [Solirubrobacteraceae bacterium]|nr:Nif3-like dinuclear metal center hexameric protein [Solirubrobacteraceae bacterium]